MLVDYSDSDDDGDDEPPAKASAEGHEQVALPGPAAASSLAAPAAAPQRTSAVGGPPAKKARVEINLQSLLQRNDAALPFEEASKLPANFFDPPTREEDAGEERPQGARGWAALSSMLTTEQAEE